jgi:acetyl esterase/lipase
MGWIYLVCSVLGVLHAVNGLHPTRRNVPLFVWSFGASWLTIELVWHHVVVGLVISAVCLSGGALDTVPGEVGLVLMVVAEGLLVAIGIVTRRTVVIVRDALTDLEPGPDAPRFPRSHVVLPFLVGHRRGVSRIRDVRFHRAGGQQLRLDVTVPSAPVPGGGPLRPALLQIHGGGWVIGDKREQGLPLLGHMAAQGWVGFNANYRLSPRATFPEHLDDVTVALAWVREHAHEYGVDPDFICVTGGSAGGHLCALLALTADPPVAAAVPFYGIYDFTPAGAFGQDRRVYDMFLQSWVMKAFVDEEPEKYEAASPIHLVHPDAPPFLVVHGDRDTLAPVEDARAFVARLRDVSRQPVAYAEMQGAQHAFEIFPSARSARVIEGVERFLSTLWERRHAPRPAAEADRAEALTD